MVDDTPNKKKEYKAAFTIVRGIIWKYEPFGISRNNGAPDDEFDMEIAHILPMLQKGLSEDELAAQMESVFIISIGGGKPVEEAGDSYKRMTREILAALAKIGLLQFQRMKL